MMIFSQTSGNFDFIKKRRWLENAKSYLHSKFHQFSTRIAPVGTKLLLRLSKEYFFSNIIFFGFYRFVGLSLVVVVEVVVLLVVVVVVVVVVGRIQLVTHLIVPLNTFLGPMGEFLVRN